MKMYCNIDINSVCTPFLNAVSEKSCFTEELLYPMVDCYQGTGVTDLLFNIFCQYSAAPSVCWTDFAAKYEQKQMSGERVCFEEEYRGLYRLHREYRTDPYEVWIRRCRQVGIHPWLSFRMNDCHPNLFLKSDFFEEARLKGWLLGAEYDYFGECFNYKIEEVRRRMLRYLEEQINRYDVDGVELDFMREIFCFDYLHEDMQECTALMNAFLREVRRIVDAAAKACGHPVRLAVRLSRDIDQSLYWGFDARTWAREGLVDVIVPSPRWGSSDSGIPVAAWKEALPNVEIPGCLEHNISTRRTESYTIYPMTAEMARGHAAGFLAAGADGIYLYNYFGETDEEGRFIEEIRDPEVWRTCHSLEEIRKYRTRFVIVNQEATMCPPGFVCWEPLPVRVGAGECRQLEIRTGSIPAGKKLTLLMGFSQGTMRDLEIGWNGKLCDEFTECEKPEPAEALWACKACFRMSVNVSDDEVQVITLQGVGNAACVHWAELIVE